MLAQTTQTSYRLGASMYVNSLMSAAEADPANFSCYTYPVAPTSNGTTNCAAATTYMPTWAAGAATLKGVSDTPPTSVYNALSDTLTITVYWKLPQEKSTDPVHSVSTTIQPTSGS